MVRISEGRAEVAARELLAIRGWDISRPPKGNVLWKNEYRQYSFLTEVMAVASKTGRGAGYPEFVVVDAKRARPLMVGETKAESKNIEAASSDAIHYASAFAMKGIDVLAVGIAGSAEDEISVRVQKRKNGRWKSIDYHKEPIQWIPTPGETEQLLLDPSLFTLDPEVPPADVLADRADSINRILRECRVNDRLRPAAVAAFMLALWKTHGNIRTHPEYVLLDVNAACKGAFREAGKHEIADSITVDPANDALSNEAHRIIRILKLLNVTTLTAAHDYLGQLYEQFFRFTGANTIGQFFTPRHVTRLMADICEVNESDFVVDPACGSGGFLIASLYRMIGNRKLTHSQVSNLVRDHLWGFESDPIVAALCVANMILRGDGTTGVIKGDCFTDSRYPIQKASVVLGNPPFPHKKTDDPPEKFVDRALEALRDRGLTAMVLPSSLLVKGGVKAQWRERVLRKNTLLAIIKLPDELFEPYAKAYTNIVILQKGGKHRRDRHVFFGRIENDGFRLKKSVRVEQPGEQLTETLEAFQKKRSRPGWYGWTELHESDWSPGAYIESAPAGEEDVRSEVEDMLRSDAALHARFADRMRRLYERLDARETRSHSYRTITRRRAAAIDHDRSLLGYYFNIYYGQRELHSKDWLEPGDSLIVSSSGEFNGCYGFYDYSDKLIRPPFATVPSTGSIGLSFVQRLPCGVTDDCLLLFPKEGTPPEALYIAAAVVRLERWRFSYGRKITPDRIMRFKLPMSDSLLKWIKSRVDATAKIGRRIVESFAHEGRWTDLFDALSEQWTRDRRRGADVHELAMHPAYQRIIGMGENAIPLILEAMKQRQGHWFWALNAITGQNPIPEEHEGNMRQMTRSWLKWGLEHGYIDSMD